jgi:hypothetical protein
MTFPQELKIDYVRVYAAPRAEEHFEASFVDDTVGWKKVVIPFAHFARRPELLGASADGLDLSAVTGYGLHLPENTRGSFLLDEVRLYYVYYLLMYNRSPRQIP